LRGESDGAAQEVGIGRGGRGQGTSSWWFGDQVSVGARA
jgi:hypothetical protein